ncbi:MAG TPA: DUF4349 domain-containing protein [Candidatus Limnocylindria bacterium]|jgi:hypothetical protein|nr:DUF4349 domain-containing protein [Candidatus Limnocylindria bacterium]
MENYLKSIVVRFRRISPAERRLVFAGCLLAVVFLLFFTAANRVVRPGQHASPLSPNGGSLTGEVLPPDGVRSTGGDAKEVGALAPLRMLNERYSAAPVDSANAFRESRIAYSAELSVVTREFAHSRSSLEEILDRHRGYVAKLRMVGQPSGSVLSATLRVPSSEYRSALSELKAVGLVEHEEEAADEITQQHSELEARLVNAQNEEQRLQKLLQNRLDKSYDPASLSRQVALLRSEIERIETERSASGSRVSFANVFFSLREERTSPAETIGAKLRNAAVGGLSDAFESASTILLFLASRGPLLAFWTAMLYFPARFFWRRRSPLAFSEAEVPKNS